MRCRDCLDVLKGLSRVPYGFISGSYVRDSVGFSRGSFDVHWAILSAFVRPGPFCRTQGICVVVIVVGHLGVLTSFTFRFITSLL